MFNESAIIDYHILLYTRIYDIFLREKISKKLIRLENKEFRSFCYEVLHIGELITDTAKRINIPENNKILPFFNKKWLSFYNYMITKSLPNNFF